MLDIWKINKTIECKFYFEIYIYIYIFKILIEPSPTMSCKIKFQMTIGSERFEGKLLKFSISSSFLFLRYAQNYAVTMICARRTTYQL